MNQIRTFLLIAWLMVAFLLWLMQRIKRVGFGQVRRPFAQTHVTAVVSEPTGVPMPAANS